MVHPYVLSSLILFINTVLPVKMMLFKERHIIIQRKIFAVKMSVNPRAIAIGA